MKKAFPFNKDMLPESGIKPTLLLHSCCGPCSSSVLEMLCEHFQVTVLYYNPNIWPNEEYTKRCHEQKRFCKSFSNAERHINFVATDHRPKDFAAISKGREEALEGGERCTLCYALRLEETAKYARDNGFDFFTTTLSVSPLKDADRLNAIGESLAKKYNVKYLTSDFKKQNGYKRSCELSKEYGMYRQSFCGCKYSFLQRLMSAKAFIFDADGTLFDTMQFYETLVSDYIRSFGIEPDADIRDQVRSHTIKECCPFLKEKYNLPLTPEEIFDGFDEILTNQYKHKAPLKDGVKDFLVYARQKGIKMCIATATDSKYIGYALKAHGIEELFEFVLTCSDVDASKRESKVYDVAASRLGVDKKDAVIFEDAQYAILTAKNALYRVVAVEDLSQAKFEESIKSHSDIYVHSMKELLLR